MNGRVFAKRFVGTALILFGIVCLVGDGALWIKAVAFFVFVAIGLMLFRRTRADDAWMVRRRCGDQSGRRVEHADGSQTVGKGGTGGFLAINAVLGVLATPFVVLAKLLKMQK